MTSPVEIRTQRFVLRELAVTDVSERYLSWLGDAAARKYITAAAVTCGLKDLHRYVEERAGRDDVLFLGIFHDGLHIGNIKYEPLDSRQRYAIMGILIGDPAYRGMGVTPEVLTASARWLQKHRAIEQIVLGVSLDNPAAIRAYEKVGFVVAETQYLPEPVAGTATMVWRLEPAGTAANGARAIEC